MLEFKKSELEQVLLSISAYSSPKEGEPQKLIAGLLTEDLTLGTKRKLQKIHKLTLESHKEFIEDFKELQKSCKTGEDEKGQPIYDKEKLEKEVKELLEEVVKIEADPIDFSFIENVSTSNNYNFETIEKFVK